MPTRRTKGDGGLVQRHDHPTCPPRRLVGHDETGKPIYDRAKHTCKGRWAGTVDVPLPGNKTKRKYVYGRTQADARKLLTEAVRQRDAGTLAFDGALTVAAWMEKWLQMRRRPPKPLKPQTWNGYAEKNRNWITPYLGTRRLSTLRGRHIEELYDLMREQGKAEATVRQVHAILSKALTDAMRGELLAVNPIERVNPPGTHTNKREQFTLAQARQALAAAGDSARWWLALFYGMRQGECLGLDWRYVDFTEHTLSVEETDQADYENAGRILGAPKSDAGRRMLPMVGQIESRMRLLWESQGRPRAGRVFVDAKGDPVAPRADWDAWRAFIDSATVVPLAPLPYIALHAARNSAASLMEAAGIPDRLVAQVLGHAQVRITHGYQKADVARMRTELGQVELLLAPEPAAPPAGPSTPAALRVSRQRT